MTAGILFERRRAGRRGGGFALLELMVGLALLGLLFAFSGHLISATLRLPLQADAAAESRRRLDNAVALLREDVWAADTIQIEKALTLTLHRPGGRSVTWRVTDRLVERTVEGGGAGESSQYWEDPPKGLTFESDGRSIRLRLPPEDGDGGAEIRFASQVQLARGGPS